MTSEEQLIKRYFDAFSRHDVEGVVACFHDEAVLVAPDGRLVAGIAEVRRSYEAEFAKFCDAHCELRVCTGNGGHGVAESYFTDARRTRKGRGNWRGSNGDRRRQDQGNPGQLLPLRELRGGARIGSSDAA